MSSIYLHIPYCDTKCCYCDFYSIENHDSKNIFIKSLIKEISTSAKIYSDKEVVETIFFGGGTPSLLEPNELELILNSLYNNFTISDSSEVTLEANPGTVNLEKLKAYRSLGINRLSFGVQSFNNDELIFLSRIHTGDEARDAIKLARKAGFDNLNIDLMFSLPNQTIEKLKFTLNEAFSFSTEHISAYSLIVEPNTPLFKLVQNKIVSPLPVDDDAKLYNFILDQMSLNGFEQYEVSNFCKPGYHSRHNSNYWNHTNYLGFGPSAHSFWKNNFENAKRWSNHRNITKYCDDLENNISPISMEEFLTKKDLSTEFLFLGLRSSGIDLNKMNNIYDKNISIEQKEKIQNYIQKNYIELNNNFIHLTKKGYMVCDSIIEQLL
ncbi:MAG: radical SAM family heme chaperone HemW [Bacteroidetes bacterium]|nr:radical SAM family heme chaperone HemW [Bacteroidota bacterium]